MKGYLYSAQHNKLLGSPAFNLLAFCTCSTQACRFLLEEFCLSLEWTLAPFWPVIDKRKLRKRELTCAQRVSL